MTSFPLGYNTIPPALHTSSSSQQQHRQVLSSCHPRQFTNCNHGDDHQVIFHYTGDCRLQKESSHQIKLYDSSDFIQTKEDETRGIRISKLLTINSSTAGSSCRDYQESSRTWKLPDHVSFTGCYSSTRHNQFDNHENIINGSSPKSFQLKTPSSFGMTSNQVVDDASCLPDAAAEDQKDDKIRSQSQQSAVKKDRSIPHPVPPPKPPDLMSRIKNGPNLPTNCKTHKPMDQTLPQAMEINDSNGCLSPLSLSSDDHESSPHSDQDSMNGGLDGDADKQLGPSSSSSSGKPLPPVKPKGLTSRMVSGSRDASAQSSLTSSSSMSSSGVGKTIESKDIMIIKSKSAESTHDSACHEECGTHDKRIETSGLRDHVDDDLANIQINLQEIKIRFETNHQETKANEVTKFTMTTSNIRQCDENSNPDDETPNDPKVVPIFDCFADENSNPASDVKKRIEVMETSRNRTDNNNTLIQSTSWADTKELNGVSIDYSGLRVKEDDLNHNASGDHHQDNPSSETNISNQSVTVNLASAPGIIVSEDGDQDELRSLESAVTPIGNSVKSKINCFNQYQNSSSSSSSSGCIPKSGSSSSEFPITPVGVKKISKKLDVNHVKRSFSAVSASKSIIKSTPKSSKKLPKTHSLNISTKSSPLSSSTSVSNQLTHYMMLKSNAAAAAAAKNNKKTHDSDGSDEELDDLFELTAGLQSELRQFLERKSASPTATQLHHEVRIVLVSL